MHLIYDVTITRSDRPTPDTMRLYAANKPELEKFVRRAYRSKLIELNTIERVTKARTHDGNHAG